MITLILTIALLVAIIAIAYYFNELKTLTARFNKQAIHYTETISDIKAARDKYKALLDTEVVSLRVDINQHVDREQLLIKQYGEKITELNNDIDKYQIILFEKEEIIFKLREHNTHTIIDECDNIIQVTDSKPVETIADIVKDEMSSYNTSEEEALLESNDFSDDEYNTTQ